MGILTCFAGLSKIVAIVIAFVLIIVAVAGIYFAMPSYFHSNTTSGISIEALSLNTSASNISSTVNVNSPSPLVRMDFYLNGTLVGYCNYSWSGSTMMSNGIPVTTRNWNNGTYSMMFSISPQYLPRMSEIQMKYNAAYMVEMVAHFQNGATHTVSDWIYVDNNGISTMMEWGAWWSNMMTRYNSVQTISKNDVISDMHDAPSNTDIFSNNDTIVFTGTQNVTILAIGMMPDVATNLTGMDPPSYASDDVFVIYGLIDPTLVVPSGVHINLIFANLDDDMYHNFVVTSLAPPYYNMPMQGMMLSNSSTWNGGGMGAMMSGYGSNSPIFGTTMPLLSPANDTPDSAYYYATAFNLYSYSADYWYICTYPGHAQSGMYGRIMVNS